MNTDRTATPITAFRGDYAFLSNFYKRLFVWNGVHWPTAEHAYQAAKTRDHDQRAAIAAAPGPGEAKKLGRRATIRPSWDVIKRAAMQSILIAKFAEPSLARRLAATGDARLVEGNWWNDTYWGVCRGRGHNHLGKILMLVRANLDEIDPTDPGNPPARLDEDRLAWFADRCDRVDAGVCLRPGCLERAGIDPDSGRMTHLLDQPTCPGFETFNNLVAHRPR